MPLRPAPAVALLGAGGLYLAALAASLVVCLAPEARPRPLVTQRGWTVEGRWRPDPRPEETEIRRSILTHPATKFLIFHAPKDSAATGRVVSAGFAAPKYITIPYCGFPFGQFFGNALYLRRLDDGDRLDVARAGTGNGCAEATFRLPKSWRGRQVELVAEARGSSGFLTVGTPFAVSWRSLLKARAVAQLVPHLVAFLVLFLVGFAAALLVRRRWPIAPFPIQAAAVGGLGYLAFFVAYASPAAGIALSLVAVAAALAIVGYHLKTASAQVEATLTESATENGLWFVGSLLYVLLLFVIDTGGGIWAACYRFFPAIWSTDNLIPFAVSEAIAGARSLDGLLGHWQVSDRPPLQTGVVLLLRPFLAALHAADDGPHLYHQTYHVAGIVLNALWLPAASFVLSRGGFACGSDRRLLVLAAAATPFALFNSIYVWPKMLSGAYGLLAFAYLLKPRDSEAGPSTRQMAAGALFAALSLLAHGAGLLALAIVVVWGLASMRGPARWRRVAVAAAVGAALLLPWMSWQRIVQPGGDVLLKSAFAGEDAMWDREIGVLTTISRAYAGLGLSRWLEMRWEGVRLFVGALDLSQTWRFQIGVYAREVADLCDGLRFRDFYFFFPGMTLSLALALLFVVRRLQTRSAGDATPATVTTVGRLVVWALLSYALALLVMWNVHILHAMPYPAHLALIVGGPAGVLAVFGRRWALRMLAATALYSAAVWIADPIVDAARFDGYALFGFVAFSLAAVASAAEPDAQDEPAPRLAPLSSAPLSSAPLSSHDGPPGRRRPLYSIVIPAHDEESNLPPTIAELESALRGAAIPFEIVVVDDNSGDRTAEVAAELAAHGSPIRVVRRNALPGFGRAVRAGIAAVHGEVVAIVMADRSDDPVDVVRCYRKIEEGYDCVFGSRFRPGSRVDGYPIVKLIVNRIVNRAIQLLFWTRFNDLTNAFKVYRTDVLAECGPFSASHFNITIEMSLSALIRRYHIAELPIRWHGRTWGSSKLRLTQMGRRYLSVLLRMFSERLLVADDILAERLLERRVALERVAEVEERVARLESDVSQLRTAREPSPARRDEDAGGG